MQCLLRPSFDSCDSLADWQVAPAPGEGPLDQPVTLPRRESSGVRIMWRVAAEDEFQRLWSEHDPWTRRKHIVEVAGSFIIFIGTLFYKVWPVTCQICCSCVPHNLLLQT